MEPTGLLVVAFEVRQIHGGQFRVAPVDEDVFSVASRSGVRVVEASELDRLAVGHDDLVVLDRIDADRANVDVDVGVGVDECGERCARLPARSSLMLFFSSATRRTSTPRFFARNRAAVTGELVKL